SGAITINLALARSGVSTSVQLRWEAWNGSTWALLGTTTPTAATGGSLTDSGKAFTRAGTGTFTLPASLGPKTVNGIDAKWVRVQIIAGNYGVESTYTPDDGAPGGFTFSPPTFAPPLVSALTIDYTITATTPTNPDAAVAFNNAQFQDLGTALAA